MLTPLILFFGLIVATAVIAYWSDNLGKKLGKKRVSLFGLRPRTTATVLTITSSWAIMLFTLVVLLAVVTPLRRALFRYDKDRAAYRRDINAAKAELSDTRGRLDQTLGSFERTQEQLVKARNSLGKARKDVEASREDATKARESAATALQGEKRALAVVARAQGRAVSALGRYKAAQSRFQAAQSRLEAAQERANAALAREAGARRSEQQADQLTRRARKNLRVAREELQGTRSDLENAKAALKEAEDNLRIIRDSEKRARALAKKTSAEVVQLEAQRVQLQLELERLTQITTQLVQYTSQLEGYTSQLEGDVEIPAGRTFAAGIIESGKSQARIEENLRQLLSKGNESLSRLPFEFPEDASLELLPLPQDPEGRLPFLSGEEVFKRLAREIAQSEEPTSVRLVAVRNVPVSEIRENGVLRKNIQIQVRFVAVKVATAFRAGEVLATDVIDGRAGDAGVFNKLLNLTDVGRGIAIDRRVNPPQSPQEPNFYASGTNVALFAALRRIEAAEKPVRVRLVASDDLSTVEPLRVRFEIEDENPSPTQISLD